MKGLTFFLIFPMLVMFSICVFAMNRIVKKEAPFGLDRGSYRVAADHEPAGNNALIGSSAYTHSQRIVTDDVQYPTIRINDYASASISSLSRWNVGTFNLDVEVPRKAATYSNFGYDGIYSFYDYKEITRDIWMGSPNLEACKATAKMKENTGISCEAKIPW
ncbi:MAG: hypothetical protein OXU23_00930 [Candidatus Poribacteria bacterium]|nr:hypothetical protein [Candidatus Poribacteria bacterium]